MDSTWISSKGKFITQFENSFSEFVGVKHSVAVCNGTVAIHVALLALGIGDGDEVIVPSFTYIASVNAIKYTGQPLCLWTLIYIPGKSIQQRLKKRLLTKQKQLWLFIFMASLVKWMQYYQWQKHKLFVIEDCAEAFGSLYNGKHIWIFW